MTATKCLLWLAEREQDCYCWHVIDRNEGRTGTIRRAPVMDCPDCHGTGRVQMFLTLRKECSHCKGRGKSLKHLLIIDTTPAYELQPEDYESCRKCQGRGWVVAEVPLGTLLAIALGLLDSEGYIVIGQDGVALVGFPDKPQQDERIWEPGSLEEALPRAIVAAVQAQAERK